MLLTQPEIASVKRVNELQPSFDHGPSKLKLRSMSAVQSINASKFLDATLKRINVDDVVTVFDQFHGTECDTNAIVRSLVGKERNAAVCRNVERNAHRANLAERAEGYQLLP